MFVKWSPVLVLSSLMVLAGCENKGEISGPEVGTIYSQVIHYHPSFIDKHGGSTATGSLFAQAILKVSDPDGLDDLNTLSVDDLNNSANYELVNRLPNESIGAHFDNPTDTFFDVFEADGLDRIDLDNWRVNVKDLQGYTNAKTFSYALFDGDVASTEEFVYSPNYTGLDTADGVLAMEAMTIADNNITFTRDSASQLFTISFDVTDVRASNYAIWFYDDSALSALPTDIVSLESFAKGVLPVDAASIQDNPIVGGTTSLTVNWAEIERSGNALASSFDGIHIVLYDAEVVTSFNTNGHWFSQSGISEYVPVTP